MLAGRNRDQLFAAKNVDTFYKMSFEQKFHEASELYNQKDFRAAQNAFENILSEEPSSDERRACSLNIASCLASLGKFGDSLERYNSLGASNSHEIQYNRALCNYKLSNYDAALDILDDLLATQSSSRQDQQKFNRSATETDGRAVKDSLLARCLNLKAAVLHRQHQFDEARGLWAKSTSEDDYVSLHNRAICASTHPNEIMSSLKELLLNQAPSKEAPDEAVENLTRLILRSGDLEAVNELLDTKNRHLFGNLQTREFLMEVLETMADSGRVSRKATAKKMEQILEKSIGKYEQDDDAPSQLVSEIELISSHLAALLWDCNQYRELERILLKVEPILSERSQWWSVWFAHSLFMQDTRYEECCYLYEKLLAKQQQAADELEAGSPALSPLGVDPMVLANLCVSYLLTGKNDSAESLIKEIEQAERQLERPRRRSTAADRRQLSNSCIVNLVIGQLYCVKFNYSFGLPRIFKTLEPLDLMLTSETWLLCKRCIMSLLDNHCKSMIYVRDDLFEQIVSFLCECELQGIWVKAAESYEIAANLETKLSEHERFILMGRNSVTYEARYLRSLVLSVLHD